MKAHLSNQWKHGFCLDHAYWLAIPLSCLMCAGCFLSRDPSAWSDPIKVVDRYAILPVLPEQVRITVEGSRNINPYEISMAESNVKNHKEVAHVINEVLDTIAANENNDIEGPSKFSSVLRRSKHWKYFQVYLNDLGSLQERWKQEGLAEISRQLGYRRVLYVTPTLRYKQNLSFRAVGSDPFGRHWEGRIGIKVDVMDLATAQFTETAFDEANFFGDIGVLVLGGYSGVLTIPYAFGKAFDRAADQAIRKALARLFAVISKGGIRE